MKKIDRNELRNVINNMLLDLGFKSNINGHHYLIKAIELVFNDSSYISSVTKRLYPEIASDYNTNIGSVERSIRTAIESAWNRRIEIEPKKSGWSNSSKRPSNAEFIMMMSDNLKYQYNKEYKYNFM